ncbi:MAG: polyprenyl synthetase family protein, partial [Bacteroidales bacterium]|nr:polyprenyl synthetase family protein [Bacteroidales bacterium]
MITDAAIDIAVKKLFDEIEFTKEPAGLYDPLRYMIAIGGKRIRPRLCMIAYALFKDELGDELLQPASALEVFHSFTLIHDDIMDRSPLRRGVPTVWKKWNSDTAILSGDVMLIDAYRRIAMAPASCHAEVLGLFTKTAAEVCDGQQFDMDFENEAQVPMADYMKMIGLKTAVLIACAAKMGALIAGASQKDADALYEYGYQLGLAFQVADDYLDAYGDEKVFGKPIGGDIVNDKKSWMVIRALEKASDRQALLEKMAMLGLNLLMLYTEDTYEVEGQPYWGYLRGRYSKDELREIDRYAEALDIELVPCIQTLGHMDQFLQWNNSRRLRDQHDILPIDLPDTY